MRYSSCQDQCITHQFLIEAYLFNQHCQWISSSVILLHIPLCFSPPGADPPRAVFSICAGLLSCSRRPPARASLTRPAANVCWSLQLAVRGHHSQPPVHRAAAPPPLPMLCVFATHAVRLRRPVRPRSDPLRRSTPAGEAAAAAPTPPPPLAAPRGCSLRACTAAAAPREPLQPAGEAAAVASTPLPLPLPTSSRRRRRSSRARAAAPREGRAAAPSAPPLLALASRHTCSRSHLAVQLASRPL